MAQAIYGLQTAVNDLQAAVTGLQEAVKGQQAAINGLQEGMAAQALTLAGTALSLQQSFLLVHRLRYVPRNSCRVVSLAISTCVPTVMQVTLVHSPSFTHAMLVHVHHSHMTCQSQSIIHT
jgi:hypothetical protein